jgi:hypothetical protein
MPRKLLVYVASVREDQVLDDGRHPAMLETKGDVLPLRPVVLCQVDNDKAVAEGKSKLLEGIDKIVAATRESPRQAVSSDQQDDGNKKYGDPAKTRDPKILLAREREARGE